MYIPQSVTRVFPIRCFYLAEKMTSSSFLTGQQSQRAHWSLLTPWSWSYLHDVKYFSSDLSGSFIFGYRRGIKKY